MAIAYVDSTSNTGNNTNLTNNVPSVSDGNVIFAFISLFGIQTITAPGGWTFIRQDDGASSRTAWWWRVAASEPASYTWTVPSAATYVADMIDFSGVDQRNPVGAHNGANDASGTSVVAPSITTLYNNSWLLTLHGVLAAATFTPPGGMTERRDVNSVELCTEALGTAGATGTRTATASSAGLRVGQSIEIKAAVSDILKRKTFYMRAMVGR